MKFTDPVRFGAPDPDAPEAERLQYARKTTLMTVGIAALMLPLVLVMDMPRLLFVPFAIAIVSGLMGVVIITLVLRKKSGESEQRP